MTKVANLDNKLRIVYLANSLMYVSGGIRVIIEHVNGLAARGYDVELWTEDKTLASAFQCNVPMRNYDRNQLSEPDVVVVCDPTFVPKVAEQREHKRTILLMQHDNEWLSEISGENATMHVISEHMSLFVHGTWAITAVSNWVGQVIAEKYGITCEVVPNGIDQKLFHPAPPTLNTPNPKILLSYAPQPWKGFPEAVRAALDVKCTHKDVEIVILGGILLDFPEDNPAYHHFSFSATVFNIPDQSMLAGIYSSATVFVSTSWKEGFGLPGLEALACGTPLVTTDSGGVREYAVPDKTAIVVAPDNARALADGIRKILDNPTLQHELSRNGIDMARQFTWDKSLDKLEQIIKGGKLEV